MYGYIYITQNLINGKKYIGQHRCDHFDLNYIGSGVLLLKAIQKYGKKNFTCKLLKECFSEDDLNQSEIEYITKYQAVESDNFYNVATGGNQADNLAGKSEEEKLEIIERWRSSMNSRSEEERLEAYKKWKSSNDKHTEKQIAEIQAKRSEASKKAYQNRDPEVEALRIQRIIDAKMSKSLEEKALSSKNYTAANIRRWENMPEEKLTQRTEKYKNTRNNRSEEAKAETSRKLREAKLRSNANESEEHKAERLSKCKNTWKNKPADMKQAYSEYCKRRSSGRIWVNNCHEEHLITANDLQMYEENGYKKGRLKKSKEKI